MRVVLAFLITAMLPGTAAATYRVMRVLDWQSGLPVSFTGSVEQDPQGFLWLVTSGGVYRFDGSEMVQKLTDRGLVPGSVTAGALLTFVHHDAVLEIRESDGQQPITGPDGEPVRVDNFYMSRDRALWVLHDGSLRRRDPDGTWSPRFPLPEGARWWAGMQGGRNHTLFIPCREAVYRLDRTGRFETVARVRGPIAVIDRADGSTAIGTFVQGRGYVYEVRDGVLREIDRHPTRFMSLAERDGVLWIAYDNTLVRLERGQPRETITQDDGIQGGGGLLVDQEGSLWVAGGGLVQFPEPDTSSWMTEAKVLGRHVVLDGDGVWMSSWGGLYRARRQPDGWILARQPAHIAAPCLDRSGNVWVVHPDAFSVIRRHGPQRFVRQEGLSDAEECAIAPDGGLWFPTAVGLFFLAPGAERPRLVLAPERGREPFRYVYEDSHGTVWGARQDELCQTPGRELEHWGRASWDCVTFRHQLTDMLEVEKGSLWATTYDAGVWRLREGTWEQIPGSRDLVSPWTSTLRPSPRGGIWISGEGCFVRVRERMDLPAGWEVLERIGLWQGLSTPSVFDIAEAEDGTLWAASNKSLIRIPPKARAARPRPPPVALVDAAVDGKSLEVRDGTVIRLPHRRNRLELRFAALSYRDPSLIRYRSRLNPNEPWSAPTKQPFFRFVDLPPRRYQVEVEASLDGQQWSRAKPEAIFEILPAWYATWWFRAVAVTVLAAALWLAYRLRVASLLKLERQRMRIAMDLHDEVGSGLGSIGVLVGILARPDLPDRQRADLTTRVTGVVRELSQSLGDIVWSLRTGSGTLDSLWTKILDRARPLFADRNPALRVVAPEPVPRVPLSLVVRRNVSLIAIEALHNAARHAAASSVTLTLRSEDAGWVLVVADDGHGFQPASGDTTRRGLGLEAMRLRAEEMGGSVLWETPESGGTTVVIRFRAGRD